MKKKKPTTMMKVLKNNLKRFRKKTHNYLQKSRKIKSQNHKQGRYQKMMKISNLKRETEKDCKMKVKMKRKKIKKIRNKKAKIMRKMIRTIHFKAPIINNKDRVRRPL